MKSWTTAPEIKQTRDEVYALRDSREVIGNVARSAREMREDFADIIRVLLQTAPHDDTAKTMLAEATESYRDALRETARHLCALGDVRAELELDDVVDILWFYFGYNGWFVLHDANGWSYERSENWLADQACVGLLGS